MKTKYIIYLLAFVIAVQLYTIYNLYFDTSVNGKNDGLKYAQIIGLDYLKSLESEDYILPRGIILENSGREKVSLDSLLVSGKKLVVRHPVTACGACVEAQIPLLNQLAKKVGADKIIFIAPNSSIRILEITKRNLSPLFELYINTDLGLPIENIEESEMFLADSSHVAKKIFIPRKESPDISHRYIEMIKTELQ